MKSVPKPIETLEIDLVVNDEHVRRTVPVRRLLSDFIREDLRLTGTHVGCEQGVCGACTVLVDGASVRSCIMLAVQVDGATIRTVESSSGGLWAESHATVVQTAPRGSVRFLHGWHPDDAGGC